MQHHSNANVPLLQGRRTGAHGSRRVRGAIARRSLGAFWRQVVQHARPLADSHEFLLLRRIAGFTERSSASCRAGQCSGDACSQGCSCRGTNEGPPGPSEIGGFNYEGFLASQPCMSKGKKGSSRQMQGGGLRAWFNDGDFHSDTSTGVKEFSFVSRREFTAHS